MANAHIYDERDDSLSNKVEQTRQSDKTELPLKWGWLMLLGVMLIVGGTLGVTSAVYLTYLSILVFGAMALTAGLFQLWHVVTSDESMWSGRALHLFIAVAYLVLGGLIIWNPLSGTVSLTLLLAAFFLAVGVLRIYHAFKCRSEGWRWKLMGFGGLIDLGLAALILYGWPETAFWVIGLFIAIEMIISGWMLVGIAMATRKAEKDGLTSDKVPTV